MDLRFRIRPSDGSLCDRGKSGAIFECVADPMDIVHGEGCEMNGSEIGENNIRAAFLLRHCSSRRHRVEEVESTGQCLERGEAVGGSHQVDVPPHPHGSYSAQIHEAAVQGSDLKQGQVEADPVETEQGVLRFAPQYRVDLAENFRFWAGERMKRGTSLRCASDHEYGGGSDGIEEHLIAGLRDKSVQRVFSVDRSTFEIDHQQFRIEDD